MGSWVVIHLSSFSRPPGFRCRPPRAATDGLDTSFDTDGRVTTDIGAGTNDSGDSVAVQPDGRVIVAGFAGDDFASARYNVDGSLDTSFDTDGKLVTDVQPGSSDRAHAVTLQPDGKIVVAGSSGNPSDIAVLRYKR
ncbi:MAG TPA: delta-60 repeat domain-containing protein [Acidimicrobiales bacterium]|nr:delta-60 repeat domain-containing protein [Acidimicrobiales bacterium]